jgi:DNA polymerase III sliding clamp (beta) subunit (PCNA family)
LGYNQVEASNPGIGSRSVIMTKVVVETNLLAQALGALAPIIPKKPSRDVLVCFRVKAEIGDPDSLHIYAASDHMETFASYTVTEGVAVKKAGEFAVPAKVFLDYIKAIETDQVSIETDGEATIKIKADSTCFEAGLQDIEEFPDFPEAPDE